MALYLPALRYGFHPYYPERLGYRSLLRLTAPSLAKLLDSTDGHTLLTARNRTTLYREAKGVLRRGVAGDFMEIGVHRGGSAAVLAQVIRKEESRDLHLFDRWGDLPEPTERDGHRQEEYKKEKIADKLAVLRDDPPFLATKEVVEEIIGFPAARVHYHQGWYHETLAAYSGRKIAFASIDCDYYESVKLALAFAVEHASPGATFVVDDYGSWPGAKEAVDEWVSAHRSRATMRPSSLGTAILNWKG